jgi:2-dehydro-3-deoxyphosphogalactonate aldolase
MFLRLDTNEGTHGYGEVMMLASAFRPQTMSLMIEDLVGTHLIGRDPYAVEEIYETLYAQAGYSRYPDQTKLAVISGVEMACWDIVGKDLGQPIHRLLGGAIRDRIRTYTYIHPEPGCDLTIHQLWTQPNQVAARASYYAAQGFTAVKLDPLGTTWVSAAQSQGQIAPVQYSLAALELAEEVIRRIREAVGNRCDILIGTHGQMTAAGAIRLARRLEPYDPLWFEEPVPPENMAEMAKVAHASISRSPPVNV